MNEEIKEILDILKKCKDYDDEVFLIKQHSATLLLDYITNLQQRCEYLERSNNRREDTILGLRQEIYEQEDYKSRCEKASKKINYYKYFISLTKSEEHMLNTLDNILQNGSEDND